MSPAHRLEALGKAVGRLRPDWRDPESYFANRQQIERELYRLAREVARG